MCVGSSGCILSCLVNIIICMCVISFGASHGIRTPAPEFSTHILVQPTLHHARTKREISSTKHTSGVHEPEVTLALEMEGERRELELRLNTGLIADRHVLHYQQGGRTLVHKPTKQELELCQYWGRVRGSPGSWAAVSTCRGLRGVIHDGTTTRYIEPAHGEDIQSPHYLYTHTDLNSTYNPLLLMKGHAEMELKQSHETRHKRSVRDGSVHVPYNVNRQSRYVELVLVVDRDHFEAHGRSIMSVHNQMTDLANIINAMYAQLNIFIVLVRVVVWSEYNEIRLSEDADVTLNKFLEWRERNAKQIPNDNAQLITRKTFNEGIVGRAASGICSSGHSGGVASYHTNVTGLFAATIAHELGHNFGMNHDTELCTCPYAKCIMSPSSTSVTPTHWSSCSLKSLALTFERGMDYCLRNKPKYLFESPTCGNGFVEAGEQCDCGLVWGEEHTACTACCHPHTCMLRANATCGAGACCDLQTCRPRAAGALCRAAERECDLPEYCSGHSDFCPRDVFKMDSTPCGTEQQAYCVRGSCHSHSDQCRLLWGSTGEMSHDECYTTNNVKGNHTGNCGYNRERKTYRSCDVSDARCGLLQCQHLNDQLEFGYDSYGTIKSHSIIPNGNTILHCLTALVDLGVNDADPGMVPDGAKCGHEMMCLKQRCVSVAAVRDEIARRATSVCPSNCSGHGVCNSEGNCHCDPGFAPPLCNQPGTGGSYDSGPARDPQVQINFMVAMYVIFLGIVPALMLLLLLYLFRRQELLCWHKLTTTNLHNHMLRRVSQATGSIRGAATNSIRRASNSIRGATNYIRGNANSIRTDGERIPQQKPILTISEPVTSESHYANLSSIHAQRNANKPPKGIGRKMNKDDIQKISNHDIVEAQRPRSPNTTIAAPKETPNVIIVKQGLFTNTNELIAKIGSLKTTR